MFLAQRRIRRFLLPAATLLALGVLGVLSAVVLPRRGGAVVAAEKVDFNQSIQPVLAERCFHCHGPDPGTRKKGLRLDRPESVFKKKGLLVPGKPDKSELFERISAHDRTKMPPPDAAEKPLTEEQIALFRQWIEEGAEFREHWAFEAPVKPPIPAPIATSTSANPIDRFINAKLAEKGLVPNGEADRVTLIRRVTLDLTGLLPTRAEIDAFLADRSPDAYARAVDRLLASPTYGEHRARYWLDAARYADTHGIHYDGYRDIWPYRDFVIRAYNANMPFDKFAHLQIAGDLDFPTDVDSLVATGYIRAGVSTGEGGTITEELRVNLKRERTEAYGAAFLGLTVGCANCHDHKFDPVTQKDFYSLSAYFNNLAENPSNVGLSNWPPHIRVPKEKDLPAYNAALAKRSALQKSLHERRTDARALMTAWISQRPEIKFPVSTEGLKLRLRLDEGKGTVFANTASSPTPKTVESHAASPEWGECTHFWPAFRMTSGTKISVPEFGNVAAGEPFSAGVWVMPRIYGVAAFDGTYGTVMARYDSKAQRGWALRLVAGHIVLRVSSSHKDFFTVTSDAPVATRDGVWSHLFVTYDGKGADGVKIYGDGAPVPSKATSKAKSVAGDIRTEAPFTIASSYPDADPCREVRLQDMRFYTRELKPEEAVRVAYADRVAEVLAKPFEQMNDDEYKVVVDHFFAKYDEPSKKLREQIAATDEELNEISKEGSDTLVAQEADTLPYADVLDRGGFGSRTERVVPAVPHFLPQPTAGAPKNRRTLADWTVSPQNPLTARVTVNRMWSELFGVGIVETADDFGIMGARPVNQPLLDWLAVDFRENGWDVKRFYRQIVLSDAYRRDAKFTPKTLEEDPENRLLARGPRYRMDAEMLRDAALGAAGLLSPKIGGPSMKPYMPEGLWEAVSYIKSSTFHYVQDKGESLYRRGLYTFRKRQAMHPAMETLDSPVLDVVCTRRARTDTPLQALVMLNDPQWVEASRFLAQRAMLEGGETFDSRLDFISHQLLGTPAPAKLRELLSRSHSRFLAHYKANAADAKDLLATGEKPRDEKLDASEHAALTLVASQMLNLDATLNK